MHPTETYSKFKQVVISTQSEINHIYPQGTVKVTDNDIYGGYTAAENRRFLFATNQGYFPNETRKNSFGILIV